MHAIKLARIWLSLTAVWGLLAGEVRGQQDDPVAILTTQIEEFFENLVDPAYPTQFVFKEFVATTPLAPQETELNKLIEQHSGLQEKYGKFLEVEPVDVKKIGKDLVVLRFLYKMERYPVVWYFTYYRAPTVDNASWKLVSLKFDTRLHLLAD